MPGAVVDEARSIAAEAPWRSDDGLAERAAELIKAYKPYLAINSMDLDLLNLGPSVDHDGRTPPALRGGTDIIPG